MAVSLTRPDPSSPNAVAGATFSTARRGFEQTEVRDLLRMVAAELARLQERERYLDRELRAAQRSAPVAAVALDEEVVTRLLGEEAARILQTAREAASHIKIRAEETAARVLHIGRCVRRNPVVQHRLVIEAWQNRHAWRTLKLHAIQLDGQHGAKGPERVDERLRVRGRRRLLRHLLVLDERARLQLGKRLPQFGLRVHHDWAVPGDRFFERTPRHEQ